MIASAIFIQDDVGADRHGDEFRSFVVFAGDDDGEPVDGYFVRARSRDAAFDAAERMLDRYSVTEIVDF